MGRVQSISVPDPALGLTVESHVWAARIGKLVLVVLRVEEPR